MSHIIDLDSENLRENLTGLLIGQGSYGIVTKSQWRGQDVAVKKFLGGYKSFRAELENLKRVNHENIIQCLAYKRSGNLIIMEFAENGSLNQLLHSPYYSNVTYNIAHALDWALQCAKGVQYLHSIKPKLIIHRDLKPLNILLRNNFTKIKICDFGTACTLRTCMTSTQGSIAYMSPEVIKGSSYNEKCDVYSWSIILWELFSRKVPHSPSQTERSKTTVQDETNRSTNCTTVGISDMALMWAITRGDRPKLLRNCPKVFEELIQSCWQESPDDRPTINEIVNKMEQYLDLVRDHLTPINQSLIIPENLQNNYLSFNPCDIRMINSTIQNYTYTIANGIPDNVDLEPHCEMIKINDMTDETPPVLKSYINYTPTQESVENSKPLEILKVERILDDEDCKKKSEVYVSTIETHVDNKYGQSPSSDTESNDLTTGCGISTFLSPKMMSRILSPSNPSRTIFYTNFQDVNELEAEFSTLTPVEHQVTDAYTKTITKHKKKNHRSEIEINNCKLNSSASSTISSSSTSVINDKKIMVGNELINGKAIFRSNEEVNRFFNSNNSPSTNEDESCASSDEYRTSSSSSSFENVDHEKIKEQIAKEFPDGRQIKYNIEKKKRGLNMKTIKKVFRTNKDLYLPPDL